MAKLFRNFGISLLRFLQYTFEDINPMILTILCAFIVTAYFVFNTIDVSNSANISNRKLDTSTDSVFHTGCVNTQQYLDNSDYQKQNATFLMLTRNIELDDVMSTIMNIESHFNQWYHYPYTFLNDESFTEEFKNEIESIISSNATFGTLKPEHWEFNTGDEEDPNLEQDMYENIQGQGDRGILYGDNTAYHKMCRFYSGFFYKHELMRQYEWYWRLEPSVEFYCDLTYDPFYEMQRSGKRYGFTILIPELYWTVPNLFRVTLSYIKENNIKVGSLWKMFTSDFNIVSGGGGYEKLINFPHDIMERISEKVTIDYVLDHGYEKVKNGLKTLIQRSQSKPPLIEDKFDDLEYNLCHFWSNFEIARVDVFDNEIYDKYFEFLEQHNGFWKERWGDAPIHSLGLSLLLDVNDIHYFRDIGYQHSTLHHCPKNAIGGTDSVLFPYIETSSLWERTEKKDKKYDKEFEVGTGCRCKCPDMKEVEDNVAYCQNIWYNIVHETDPNAERKPMHKFSDLERTARANFLREHRN